MLLRAVTVFGIMFVILLRMAEPLSAQDWPVFRGNSLQSGVADSPMPDNLTVAWSFHAQNTIEGGPIVFDQTVFVATANGKLFALDLTTGKKKWDYQAVGGVLAVPAARDGAVYFGDVKGHFHCVDAVTGKKRWSVATDGEILASANFATDKILFGSNDHHLYCVDTRGKVLWQCKTKEKIRGTAAVAGDRVLVAGCDHSLHVIDLATGKELSVVALGGHVGASVAVRGDHLYVGNMANQFLAVDWKKGAIAWQFEAKRGAQPFFSSAAVTDDLVIAGSRDKQVRAWNRHTGKETWAFATKGRVDSSPVVVGGRVVVGSMDGNLYVLDLARGTEHSRHPLGAIPNSPAVAGQRIVVATILGEVICLGARK